jgi:hypothetical protein
MSNGRIVEKGTHTSLLQDPEGVYSGLVALQSLRQGKDGKTVVKEDDAAIDVSEEPAPVLARAATAYSTHAVDQGATAEGKGMSLLNIARRIISLNKGIRWMYLVAFIGVAISGTAFPVSALYPLVPCSTLC